MVSLDLRRLTRQGPRSVFLTRLPAQLPGRSSLGEGGGLLDNNFKKVGVVIYAHGIDEVLLILYLIWTLEAITTAV